MTVVFTNIADDAMNSSSDAYDMSTPRNLKTSVISIIIVCYNEESDRIKLTLDSIINQDYELLELVVIDGGSNINTINALKEYKEKITKLISEPDRGIYDAMNKGLNFCNGDWIIFMNIGDSFHSSTVMTRFSLATKSSLAGMYSGVTVVDDNRHLIPTKTLNRYFLYKSTLCHQSIIASRAIFEMLGNFDISYKLIADRDWVYRVANSEFSYCALDFPICKWEAGGASSNYKILNQEFDNFRRLNFSRVERLLFGSLEIIELIFSRIVSLNFSIPVRIRDKIKNI